MGTRRTRWLAATLLTLCALPADADETVRGPRLVLLDTWRSREGRSTEMISVQASTKRAVVGLRGAPAIAVLDLGDPSHPQTTRRIALRARRHEELTSTAFHPSADFVFVVLGARRPKQRGRLLILDATRGRVVAEHPLGFAPGHVSVAPAGDTAVVANEGEFFWFDRSTLEFRSNPGGFTVIDLRNGCPDSTARTLRLRDQTGRPGMPTKADERRRERTVDLNGNGIIEPNEANVAIPLDHHGPANLEPESVAFSPDGTRAFLTLQENNAVLVMDPRVANVIAIHGLGTTRHASDRADDGRTSFDDTLVAFREPDGIALTPDGRHFVTADEGATDSRTSDTRRSAPSGGGRTLSVFDAQTGAFVADTGNGLDEAAHRAGVYPDGRSDERGSEPGALALWRAVDRTFAAVALGRASAVALVELTDVSAPRVIAAYPLAKGSASPEGLAVFEDAGRLYVYVANKVSGNISVFQFRSR